MPPFYKLHEEISSQITNYTTSQTSSQNYKNDNMVKDYNYPTHEYCEKVELAHNTANDK